MKAPFFVNRRSGGDRRSGADQRKNPRLDLSFRRRRKGEERRADHDLATDFFSITQIDLCSSDDWGEKH